MGWSISASILLIFCFKQAASFIRGNVTCDNEMLFFADGVLYAKSSDWTVSSAISIPGNTTVMAIKCHNIGGGAGIKAAMDNGVKTDVSWKCSNRFEAGWNQIGFDDSAWSAAVILPDNLWGSRPTSLVGKADWIWTSGYRRNYLTAYCRKGGHAASFIRGNVTCDNEMSFFADGVLYAESSDWRVSSAISIPGNTTVMAIKCHNIGGGAGIKAAMDNGVKTDVSWKCSERFEAGWNQIGFDDSAWSAAVIIHDNPWGSFPASLVGKADWIWTSGYMGKDLTAYCRKGGHDTKSSETDAAFRDPDTSTTTAVDETTTVDSPHATTGNTDTTTVDSPPTTIGNRDTTTVDSPPTTTGDTDTTTVDLPPTTTDDTDTTTVDSPPSTTCDTNTTTVDSPPSTTGNRDTTTVDSPPTTTGDTDITTVYSLPTTTGDTDTTTVDSPPTTTGDTDAPPTYTTTIVDTAMTVDTSPITTGDTDVPPSTSFTDTPPPTTTRDIDASPTTTTEDTPLLRTSDTDTPPPITTRHTDASPTTTTVNTPLLRTSVADTPPPTTSGANTKTHTFINSILKAPSKDYKKLCGCNCNTSPNTNQINTLQAKITSLQKDLRVTAKDLSSTIRRRKSATDSRLSSSIIGTTFAIILTCTMGFVVVDDILTMAKHIYTIYSNFCDARKKKSERLK